MILEMKITQKIKTILKKKMADYKANKDFVLNNGDLKTPPSKQI